MGCIGVDIGATAIRLIQVREQNGRIVLVGAGRVDYSAGERPLTLVRDLRAVYTAGGFLGSRCLVSLPRTDIHLQSLRVPRMTDDELRSSMTWEAAQRFSLDRDAMQCDFIRTGAQLQGGENREELLLVASSHQALFAHLEPLMDAGLRPIGVDVGFAALARTFSRNLRRESDASTVRSIVEVGVTGSVILIMRGDQVAFCKTVPIGGQRLDQAVAEHLQIQPQAAAELRAARLVEMVGTPDKCPLSDPSTDRAVYEAVRPLLGELVKEVVLSLRYYGVTFRGHPPERLVLTGANGLEPHLNEALQNSCKMPVVFDESDVLATLHPQVHARLNRSPGPASSWAIALGLSMRGIGRSRRSDRRRESIPARSAA